MRWYWSRIGLGALAIFVVGYGAVLLARRATSGVRNAMSSGISLPASLIPFQVDGARAGSITRVRVVPGEGATSDFPASLDIRVELEDSAPALSGCLLLLDEVTRVQAGAPFRCLRDADTVPGYSRFGEVEIRQNGEFVGRLALLVPESERNTLAGTSGQDLRDKLKTAQEASASDRLRREALQAADSLATLVPTGGDSL